MEITVIVNVYYVSMTLIFYHIFYTLFLFIKRVVMKKVHLEKGSFIKYTTYYMVFNFIGKKR